MSSPNSSSSTVHTGWTILKELSSPNRPRDLKTWPRYDSDCVRLTKCEFVVARASPPSLSSQFMKAVVEKNEMLKMEERNLLSVAYKNVVGSKR